jgi:hypothetical protein
LIGGIQTDIGTINARFGESRSHIVVSGCFLNSAKGGIFVAYVLFDMLAALAELQRLPQHR